MVASIPAQFTIIRSRWARLFHGAYGGYGQSLLLNYQNNRCCLGFYAQACGAPDKSVRRMSDFLSLQGRDPDFAWILDHLGKDRHRRLIDVNDQMDRSPSEWRTPAEQEDQVRQIFAEVGIDVQFIDAPDTVSDATTPVTAEGLS